MKISTLRNRHKKLFTRIEEREVAKNLPNGEVEITYIKERVKKENYISFREWLRSRPDENYEGKAAAIRAGVVSTQKDAMEGRR